MALKSEPKKLEIEVKTYTSEQLAAARSNGFKKVGPEYNGKKELTIAQKVAWIKKKNKWVDELKKAAEKGSEKLSKEKRVNEVYKRTAKVKNPKRRD